VLVQQAPSIARAMLQVYLGLHALPCSAGGSAGVRHCSFTPRDLTAWVEGLQRCVTVGVVSISKIGLCRLMKLLLASIRILRASEGCVVNCALLPCCCRYDLSCVDALEAFAAEGLAVFSGRLPDSAAALQELLLTALRANLGYRGARVVCCLLQVWPPLAACCAHSFPSSRSIGTVCALGQGHAIPVGEAHAARAPPSHAPH
jgi:hypothetical protein